MIVIVFGLPGSGKTYFAERLAERLGGYHLSSDVIRKELAPSPNYSETEKELIYKKMFNIMYDYADSEEPLILDGTFYKSAIRDNFIAGIERLGRDIKFIEISADEKLIKKRIDQYRETSDANFAIYQQIKEEFEPYNEEHLVLISKKDNEEEMLHKALFYLGQTEADSSSISMLA